MALEIIKHNVDECWDAAKARFDDALEDFRYRYTIEKILAFSGGAENVGEDVAEQILHDFCRNIHGRVAILTGGTNDGIPRYGLEAARQFNLPTVGVFPRNARKDVIYSNIDLPIEATPPAHGDPTYGTETPEFVSMTDGMMVIGGGFGTMVEVAIALKISKGRIKKQNTPIYVCPILGTGGVADMVQVFPDIDKVTAALPGESIRTGKDAALFFNTKMNLI